MIIKKFESFALGFLRPINACVCKTDKMQMAGQGNQREIIAIFTDSAEILFQGYF